MSLRIGSGDIARVVDEREGFLSKAPGHVKAVRIDSVDQFPRVFRGVTFLHSAEHNADCSGNRRPESVRDCPDAPIVGDNADGSVSASVSRVGQDLSGRISPIDSLRRTRFVFRCAADKEVITMIRTRSFAQTRS